jgi:hypothetical protein
LDLQVKECIEKSHVIGILFCANFFIYRNFLWFIITFIFVSATNSSATFFSILERQLFYGGRIGIQSAPIYHIAPCLDRAVVWWETSVDLGWCSDGFRPDHFHDIPY